MKWDESILRVASCWALAAIFAVGLLRLGVKLREFQVEDAADYRGAASRQSARRVRVPGLRGRILDRRGETLAESRLAACLVCDPAQFQRRRYEQTCAAIGDAARALGQALGRETLPSSNTVARHIHQLRAMPLVVWRGLDERELAVFAEHEADFPGFAVEEEEVRAYPCGPLAAQLLGYVGRDSGAGAAADGEKFHFYLPELRGRAGLETYYDSYLRGVPGERELTVDANSYTIRARAVEEPQRGLDLRLALDPRTGDVLAFASAPGYDPNDFVPRLDPARYRRLADDPAKPLLNRASGGAYAPGSTFKPLTALAGLSVGYPPGATYPCDGVYARSGLRLRCASRWGHGELDLRHALMKSCNPYFCNLATEIGTNALLRTARAFGLGAKTGLDLGVDMAGVVPTPARCASGRACCSSRRSRWRASRVRWGRATSSRRVCARTRRPSGRSCRSGRPTSASCARGCGWSSRATAFRAARAGAADWTCRFPSRARRERPRSARARVGARTRGSSPMRRRTRRGSPWRWSSRTASRAAARRRQRSPRC